MEQKNFGNQQRCKYLDDNEYKLFIFEKDRKILEGKFEKAIREARHFSDVRFTQMILVWLEQPIQIIAGKKIIMKMMRFIIKKFPKKI